VVMTELFYPDGTSRRAALMARRDGQRMAALPCAFAAHTLAAGTTRTPGVLPAYDFLGASALLERLVAESYELHQAAA
jgi:hypothetical protein